MSALAPQGGPPPALLQMLAAAHAGPPGGSAGTAGPPPPLQEGDPVLMIQRALSALKAALSAEEPEDRAVIAQCIAALTKLQAKDQQEKDGLLAGKFNPRALRKTSGPAY